MIDYTEKHRRIVSLLPHLFSNPFTDLEDRRQIAKKIIEEEIKPLVEALEYQSKDEHCSEYCNCPNCGKFNRSKLVLTSLGYLKEGK